MERARDCGLVDFNKPQSRFSVEEYMHYEQVRARRRPATRLHPTAPTCGNLLTTSTAPCRWRMGT